MFLRVLIRLAARVVQTRIVHPVVQASKVYAPISDRLVNLSEPLCGNYVCSRPGVERIVLRCEYE